MNWREPVTTEEWEEIQTIRGILGHYLTENNRRLVYYCTPPVLLIPTYWAFDQVKGWPYLDTDERRLDHGYSTIFSIREKMDSNYCLPPAIMYEGRFLDGKHRIVAAWSLGIERIPAIRVEDVSESL